MAMAAFFAVVFLARFAWELTCRGGPRQAWRPAANDMVQNARDGSYPLKNYASSRIAFQAPGAGQQTIEQKYEKTTRIEASSSDFARDEASVRAAAEKHSAVIQLENTYGLPGGRMLSLTLGVRPENFQALSDTLLAIAKLDSVSVVKTDKTADYRALLATRASLEKTRDGLRALRAPGAPLADLIVLETKILEIEEKIQAAGVDLGDFEEDKALSTIHYTLAEAESAHPALAVLDAALSALAWSVPLCLGAFLAAAAALAAALLLDKGIERLRTRRDDAKSPPKD